MIKQLTILLFITLSIGLQAQETFKIKGIVTDTLDNPLIASTVMLMDPDSTFLDFRNTELDGSFRFEEVNTGDYIIKSTYIGYIPLSESVTSTGKDVDLGKMAMKEMPKELMEIVIKTAKARIKMRGDTIEYDVSTFQVPPGSSVESLLKKLPGIEVDRNGGIKSEGKDVNEVTVDGKKFFSNDPKMAIKNLPAEGISKIQVFDKKTEEEEITGIKSESDNKTMNLELKEDFKKGAFGQITAGIGTKAGTEYTKSQYRAELKGNINRFDKNTQVSLIGVGNNTGRNGLGWNDYEDFMGNNSFKFSGASYGFGGGGFSHSVTFGGRSNNIEQSIQSVFFNSNRNGFPENYNGGINFNYNKGNSEFNAVYFMNAPKLTAQSENERVSLLNNTTFKRERDDIDTNLSVGHKGEIQLEQKIDSLHSINIKVNGAYINDVQRNNFEQQLSNNGVVRSKSINNNKSKMNGDLINSTVTFRKKFMKKGRRFGANLSYLNTSLDKSSTQRTKIEELEGGTFVSTEEINLDNNGTETKEQVKANLIYVEPLSKKFYTQVFYNFSNRLETGDNKTTDGTSVVENLSRVYRNGIQNQRIGSSIRYSNKGINTTVGAGYQFFNLDGQYKLFNNTPSDINKTYGSFIPFVKLSYSPKRSDNYSFSYTINNTEPSIDNLQPIVNNTNPFFIREGNPNLTPETSHKFNLGYHKFNFMKQITIFTNLSYSIKTNSIISDEKVDERLATYRTYTNYKGGNNLMASISVNFPIIKNKLDVSTSVSNFRDKSYSYVNDVLNKTTSNSLQSSIDLGITPWKGGSIDLGTSIGFFNTIYEINTTQNQKRWSNDYFINFDTKIVKNLYFNSEFNYSTITNDRFNLNQRIPSLNASIYYQFLKNNRGELRFSLYNAFDQNAIVDQTSGTNAIYTSRNYNLGRYLMMTFKYDIRGLEKKSNSMFFF